MAAKFDEIWVPRIGEKATIELRRNGLFTIGLGPLIVLCVVTSSVSFSKGDALGTIVGVVSVLLAVLICAVWLQSRLKFTNQLSVRFQTKIKWYEVPRMTAQQFDEWCERRNFIKD